MPPIGYLFPHLGIDKSGGISHYYDIYDVDGNRLDFGYFATAHFIEHVKYLLRMDGPLRIKAIDNAYHIASINDINKLVIKYNGTLEWCN